VTNDQLAAVILPWAKAQHEQKYTDTIKVAGNAKTFRRYLIRLIEIRWAEGGDRTWRNDLTLAVLDESAIVMHATHRPTGTLLAISGRLATPRQWTWAELGMLMNQPDPSAAIGQLIQLKRELDLEAVESDSP
jgi:hypothetical protein